MVGLHAYVTVLFGNSIYVTGAMVLGYSLMKTKTKFDRIIMVTPDISTESIGYLMQVYTHVINISYVDVNPSIFLKSDTRFRDVFTKLTCIGLDTYDKVILLDLDMIICKNIDHLFKLEAPVACIKHHNLKFGQKIDPKLICDKSKLVGSINAGLMLLKPNLAEWDAIKSDIRDNFQLQKYKYPEQDYISLRYCDRWTSIPFNYNFQFGLTHRVKKLNYSIGNIYVIHYSSSYKPWNRMIADRIVSDDESKFIDMHKKYYQLWDNAYAYVKRKYKLPF